MSKYNIVYKGRIRNGYAIEQVNATLVKRFNFTPEKAEKLLQCGRVYIKKDVDYKTAKQYGMALKKAGLDIVLTRSISKNKPGLEAPEALGMEDKSDAETSSGQDDKRHAKSSTAVPFEFHGTGSEYFRIWIVNLMLSILTLGIYSAWAKVRRKQYFYGSTILNQSGFEYLADPLNILKGRIVVTVFFGVYYAISYISPNAGHGLSLLFIILLPWLVVRSLAFNARNSAYKNIRFGFNGTVLAAAKVFVAFPALAVLTLGILSPWAFFRQKKFIVENSAYGTAPFSFTATRKDYYALAFRALIPIVIGIVLIGTAVSFFPPASGLIGLVLYLYLFAYFSVRTTNLLYNSTLLEKHSFDADLEIKGYLGLVTVNTLLSVLTLGIFYPWAHVRTVRYKLDHLCLMAKGDLDHFVAREQKEVSALGDEAGDFFDLDIGL